MLRLLVSLISVALIQVLTAMGLLLQWAPHILRALWQTLFALVALSCVVYRSLFTWLALRFGLVLLVRQPGRTLASIMLSNVLGGALCVALGWQIVPWGIVVASVHGLVIGTAWDQLGPPRGQSLGR